MAKNTKQTLTDKIDVIHENVIELKVKMDQTHIEVKEVKETIEKQNTRVSKLEQFQSWIFGGLGVLVFLAGFYGVFKLF